MIGGRLRLFARLTLVVVLVAMVCNICYGFNNNVYANDGNVETTFFGNIKDDGDGCGVYLVINFVVDILTFGVGVAAAIGITVAGITYLTAGGNENQVIKAKRRIYEIVIGLAAYAVLWAVLSFLLPGGTLNDSPKCKEGTANDSFFTTPVETPDRSENKSGGTSNKNTSGKTDTENKTNTVASQAKLNYQVYLSGKVKPSKLSKGSGIIVVEPDDYSAADIAAIKKKGYTVLGYLSVGSYEGEREGKSYYKGLSQYKAKKMANWPENYAKVEKAGWQKYLLNRAASLKKTGYDGIWADNLDVYEYRKSDAVYNACKKILTSLKKYGYVMVNGGMEFFERAMDKKVSLKSMVDGVTQEEVFSHIKSYSGTGTFDSQSSSDSKEYQKYMKKLKSNGAQTFLLEYTKDQGVKKKIKDFCSKYGMTGYYISPDVDLHPPSSLR